MIVRDCPESWPANPPFPDVAIIGAAALGVFRCCFCFLLRRKKNMAIPIKMTNTPPATPPPIAPALLSLFDTAVEGDDVAGAEGDAVGEAEAAADGA